jgi:hypothetical protein
MQTETPLGIFVSTHTMVPHSYKETNLYCTQTFGANFATTLKMPNNNYFGRGRIDPEKYPISSGIVSTLSSPPTKFPGFEIPNGHFLPSPHKPFPVYFVTPTLFQSL